MAKPKTIYRCTECDSQFPKWQGRCNECGKWGTLQEEILASTVKESKPLKKAAAITHLDSIDATHLSRTSTQSKEVDRVLGGGIVPGSVYIVTGDPGVGKSTLLLHVATHMSGQVLYISGEESLEQIKNRVERLGVATNNAGFVSETEVGSICATIEENKPLLTIVDSLQTIHDDVLSQDAGSLTQVKASVSQLVEVAKRCRTAIFIVGHITKSGVIAGPKTLEHLVDGVLYLEGAVHSGYRILRATKNRFGSIDEVGVFEMTEDGLEEVKDPSRVFLSEHTSAISGSAVAPIIEGSRVFFVEYQALVSRTSFGYPVRKSVGFDANRLHMLIAVLQKRLGLPLHEFDVHVNVAGGVRFQEPASDAAVIAALISALKNIPLPQKTLVCGEVGLAGEIRSVSFLEKRVAEAVQLGYIKIVGPKAKKPIQALASIASVKDLNTALFSRT